MPTGSSVRPEVRGEIAGESPVRRSTFSYIWARYVFADSPSPSRLPFVTQWTNCVGFDLRNLDFDGVLREDATATVGVSSSRIREAIQAHQRLLRRGASWP